MRIYEEAIDRDLNAKRFENVMATTAQAAEVRNAWMLYCTRKFPLVALRSLQGYDTVVQGYLTSAPGTHGSEFIGTKLVNLQKSQRTQRRGFKSRRSDKIPQ